MFFGAVGFVEVLPREAMNRHEVCLPVWQEWLSFRQFVAAKITQR